MADPRQRIALLIDADNARAKDITEVLSDLADFGECNIRRAYGNWDQPNLKSWKERLLEQAIRPMQQYDYTRGKNATDMAMVVDAMSLLHDERPDVFALVTSDADFTPLVMHLKEKGVLVYGYGGAQAALAFRSACSRFTDVTKLGETDAQTADPGAQPHRLTTRELQIRPDLVSLLRKAVMSSADDEGWALLSTVGQRIGNQQSEDPRNYGYASWTKLLRATSLFEFKNESTPQVAVRDPRDLS